MQSLDLQTISLQGRRLIEASAGTGKTYTLVLLYLRLLLENNVSVNNLLVVTFTRAATEELRDRIRRRLREALHGLEEDGNLDNPLQAILQRVDADDARQRLKEALFGMDESAIFTIHGFCQRMLQEHAFESATPFTVTFLESEEQLRRQIIEDFWRNRFYSVSEEQAAWITATWETPGALLKNASGALSAPDAQIIPPPADSRRLLQLEHQCQALFDQMLLTWSEGEKEVLAILENDPCLQRNDKAYRKKDKVPELAAAMQLLAAAKAKKFPWLLAPCLSLLRSSVMAGKLLKKCDHPPGHPFFEHFEAFAACLHTLAEETRIRILHEARDYLLTELDHRKQSQDWMSFDDLLTRLDRSLANPDTGPALAARIHHRYPVALVDEFQDTDPLQYRILRRIYQRPDSSLFMIGDPKQAIYSFRGADIFTYIRARRDTRSADRFTMDTNYRSVPAMVAGINRLFHFPDAFIFSQDIPFQPVRAGSAHDQAGLLVDGSPIRPLTALTLPVQRFAARDNKPIAKASAERPAAEFCAREIAALLASGRTHRATINGKQVTAGDIAVLVRTHREAALMQQTLHRYAIGNVYYSQDSVFSTSEARQLYQLLCALANPANTALVNKALVTDLFGRSGTELYQLQQDELPWEQAMSSLRDYRLLWREHGFTSMFHRLLAEQQVARRLTGLPGGERSLTNYLHLAELLQQETGRLHGTESLLRWFNRQLHAPDQGQPDQQLRLEKDGDLVRIVTIHRAKGLEYPVVFLPFLWNARGMADDQPVPFHDRERFKPFVSLDTGHGQHRQLAEEERLAEELRLLYVALTRAKCCCFFCWGLVSKVESSALAHLLHRQKGSSLNERQLIEDLERLNSAAPLLTIQSWPEASIEHALPSRADAGTLAAKKFQGPVPTTWQVTSYSQLTSQHAPPAAVPLGEEPRQADETYRDIFTFPRGAVAGTCLHNILEQLDFSVPINQQRQLIREQLELASIQPEWEQGCVDWLEGILDTRLQDTFSLRNLKAEAKINELAFLFPLDRLDFKVINRALTRWGHAPFPVREGVVEGLMKGFIDLVFRHENAYYLADYKSNHLGSEISGYAPESLSKAMQEHRYDLQYLIYTVALHRYLRWRIIDYDFDIHFGGVYYLFLRGMHPRHPPGTGIAWYRPDRDLVEELDSCFGNRGPGEWMP